MPYFGERSRNRMAGVYLPLVDVFKEVVKGYDCTVLHNGGWRAKHVQDELYPEHSKVKFPKSRHNAMLKSLYGNWEGCSLAIDVAPYHVMEPHVDWNDRDSFYHFAGYARGIAEKMGLPLTWGGDWDNDYDLADQQFYDLVHFQVDLAHCPKALEIWTKFQEEFNYGNYDD